MAKGYPHLRLVKQLPKDPENEQRDSQDETLNTLLKAVLIGAGIGGGIEAMVAYFPSDIAYLTRGDFVYRLMTAAAVTGLLLPLQERDLKEGEEPKNYFGKVAIAAIGYTITTTMMYCGLEIIK